VRKPGNSVTTESLITLYGVVRLDDRIVRGVGKFSRGLILDTTYLLGVTGAQDD
jgi:hypothetical protein